MPLLTPQQYVRARQAYCYDAPRCRFSTVQTGSLTDIGDFVGIFARGVHPGYPKGINLRRFEVVCQGVFRDCSSAMRNSSFTNDHLYNLKSTSAAIVHWKMSSQGGRACHKVKNMLMKWNDSTAKQLTSAYQSRDMSHFRIGGVRIATATAFMRFLFPSDFGVMDSRVVGNHTQPEGITTLSVRRTDGYINDTGPNARKYHEEYVPFLRREASWLNTRGFTFRDIDAFRKPLGSPFRACDIEMALFEFKDG